MGIVVIPHACLDKSVPVLPTVAQIVAPRIREYAAYVTHCIIDRARREFMRHCRRVVVSSPASVPHATVAAWLPFAPRPSVVDGTGDSGGDTVGDVARLLAWRVARRSIARGVRQAVVCGELRQLATHCASDDDDDDGGNDSAPSADGGSSNG